MTQLVSRGSWPVAESLGQTSFNSLLGVTTCETLNAWEAHEIELENEKPTLLRELHHGGEYYIAHDHHWFPVVSEDELWED